MTKFDYKIIKAFSIENLEKFVNQELKKGYTVIGGIVIDTTANSHPGIPRHYLQTMVKYE